jgi:RNA polymerase sigma factor (sigma-70 family)
MASIPGSVSVWLQQLPDDDREAQEQVFKRYEPELVRYAAYRLRQMGVRGTEADDIAQEVFMGLFRRTAAGKMPELQNRDDLWLKLQRICGDRVKDARRKRTLLTESVFDGGQVDGSVLGMRAVEDDRMDECLLVVEHSLLQKRLSDRHPDLPEIARLRFQGLAVQEIAKNMSLPKRTIERRLEWIGEVCDAYRMPID